MEIREIALPEEKQRIAREVLEALPEWFGIPEAREEYIEKSAGKGPPASFILPKRGRTRPSFTSWAF